MKITFNTSKISIRKQSRIKIQKKQLLIMAVLAIAIVIVIVMEEVVV